MDVSPRNCKVMCQVSGELQRNPSLARRRLCERELSASTTPEASEIAMKRRMMVSVWGATKSRALSLKADFLDWLDASLDSPNDQGGYADTPQLLRN